MKADEALRAFGISIKVKRVELGISQEVLAERAEMARSFLSGIERGKANATIVSVCSLADALGCNPSDLWLETERRLVNAQDIHSSGSK